MFGISVANEMVSGVNVKVTSKSGLITMQMQHK